MVNKCCIPGCRAEKVRSSASAKVTLHKFPCKNPVLLKEWLKSIPRKNLTPSKHSVICSLHFTKKDFVLQRSDERRGRKVLKKAYLKQWSVPSIFSNDVPTEEIEVVLLNKSKQENECMQKC